MPSTSSSISGLNKGKGREGLESGIYGRDIPVTNHFVVTRTKIFSLKTEFFLFTEDWILITKMVISTIVLLSWDSFAFVTSNLDHLVPSVYATMHVLCLLTLIVLQKLWGCTCVHPCPYWVCSCTCSMLLRFGFSIKWTQLCLSRVQFSWCKFDIDRSLTRCVLLASHRIIYIFSKGNKPSWVTIWSDSSQLLYISFREDCFCAWA